MAIKATIIKYVAFLIVLFIIYIEIVLIFAPFGPIKNMSRFNKASRITKEAGGTPCPACGNPAQPITYSSNRGGPVTVTNYCRFHAPTTISSLEFGLIINHIYFKTFCGGLFVIGSFIFTLFGFFDIAFNVPERVFLDIRKLRKKHFVAIFVSFACYLFFSCAFFWIDQF